MLAPVGITLVVINFLIGLVGDPTRRLLFFFIPEGVHNVWVELVLKLSAIVVVTFVITALGWASQKFFGRLLVTAVERLIERLPGVRSVYNTVKQIRDTFVQQDRAAFQQCVLVQFPGNGTWVLGFATGDGAAEAIERTGSDLVNVFVPTTPNPTSGFMFMVPRGQLHFLRMSIPDGMKLVISGGAVTPRRENAP